LKEFINKNQLQNSVILLGVINSENIINYIEKADLLILPSVFDGWGMVINEALQCHVPVLASDQCGAKELVEHNKSGLIFQHNNVESLTENIEKFLNLSLEERTEMKRFASEAGKKISIPVISHYLSLCIQNALNSSFSKPIAPWLND
jgi:glycosyltransferase involved in cell wall biosynthesis